MLTIHAVSLVAPGARGFHRHPLTQELHMTTTTSRPVASPARSFPAAAATRVVGAVFALAVGYFHVIDQKGFPGQKGDDSAAYIQVLYYVLEVAAVVAAILLLVKAVKAGWFVALGVAAGPILGYLLSRGPGLPSYLSDKGHWFGDPGKPFTEFVDTASFVCEVVLLVLAVAAFARLRSRR